MKNNKFDSHTKKALAIKDENEQMEYHKNFMFNLSNEELMAYLKYVNDGFFDSVKNILDNPTITKSEIAEVKSGLDAIYAKAILIKSKNMKVAKAA